jgi:hypothetical protein
LGAGVGVVLIGNVLASIPDLFQEKGLHRRDVLILFDESFIPSNGYFWAMVVLDRAVPPGRPHKLTTE